MIAFCDYCQNNTLSVSVKGSPEAICSSCGQVHSVQFSKVDPARTKLSPDEAVLETQKYLSPELLASLQDDLPIENAQETKPVSNDVREKKVLEEIDSLEETVRNLVHKSKPGVPKPKALKVRTKTGSGIERSSRNPASQPAVSKIDKPETEGQTAGSKLGSLHLRVDNGHVSQIQMGKLANETSENKSSESDSFQVVSTSFTKAISSRSFGLQLSSLAISFSWCVQLLLGISYFNVMPLVFSWLWMFAQAVGTASLGYILACQIWDNDRQQPVESGSTTPKEPAYSRTNRSASETSKLV